ncbi:FbpB family small basic protein [Virgibacillus siamensis]|nr:FbpB family small basic protein [Virgibacillus siamensis]
MRPKYQSFDELVKQNKKELLEDEKQLQQIELRLEKKREKNSKKMKRPSS